MAKTALALILLAYLVIGTLYAVETPPWQVPDEPAHYNYIRQLAEGRLPVLRPGDYDQAYLSQLTAQRFPPALSVTPVEYEDWQPPLYYLLATPFYLAFGGDLLPLRLFSLLLGAGVVLLTYAVAATVHPDPPYIPLGAAAFVAFLPQHVAMMAGVNNDSLTELLVGLVLWLTCRALREARWPARHLLALGVGLGLGLVTKASFAPFVVVVALALLVGRRQGDRRELLRRLGLAFGPALLIAAPWWLRNVALYGGLDLYGAANHATVVVGQPRTAWWIQTYGLRAWLERGITFTFQSFWGQFGWMGVLMPTWLYRLLALWTGVLAIGLIRWWRGATRTRLHALLGLTALLVLLMYGYYNLTFVQHQGRYLFPALIPIALGAALATDALVGLAPLPARFRPLAFALPYLAMAALALLALWRWVVPALV